MSALLLEVQTPMAVLEMQENMLVLEVQESVAVLELPSGLQGIAGTPGRDGTGTAFTYTQNTPSSLWVINHNMGVQPAFVTVMDGGGSQVSAGVTHPSVNQTRIALNPPMSGVARLF